jgi:hemin uptake protein HemP
VPLMNEPSAPLPSGEEPKRAEHEENVPIRTIRSEELLKGTREVLIQHADEVYRLRLTRNGKLILQK